MKWEETIASECRYGDIAGRVFGDAEVIWEHSERGYSGSANIFARMPNGQFVHYEWTYGSCSSCDAWERRELTDDEIEAEMRRDAALLADVEIAKRYTHLAGEFSQAYLPASNREYYGYTQDLWGRLDDVHQSGTFLELRAAFELWLEQHPEATHVV